MNPRAALSAILISCMGLPGSAALAQPMSARDVARGAVFLKLGCGYALYRTCYVDPASYGQPRTSAGCRAAAIKALGAEDGVKAECVEARRGP